jgi:benzoyl-CoA reductase subunit BamC
MHHSEKKIIKEIHINPDNCNGCRACEIACAAFHAKPKYSSFNPSRARIRMVINEINDEWVAIRSGSFSKTECKGRSRYIINGKEYSECSFCSTICPDRKIFKEPDSNLPLKCDMCGEDPEQIPMCVQICSRQVLTYSYREDQVHMLEEKIGQDLETGLGSLTEKYGLEKIKVAVDRLAKKNRF